MCFGYLLMSYTSIWNVIVLSISQKTINAKNVCDPYKIHGKPNDRKYLLSCESNIQSKVTFFGTELFC